MVDASADQRLFFNYRTAAVATAMYREALRHDEFYLTDLPVEIASSNLSRIAGKFEDAGFIERQRGSRATVRLTEQGWWVFRSIAEAFTALK